VQAIYVVFGRAAIVTSHDAGAVSACAKRHLCDASPDKAPRFAVSALRAARIFIEKNRLFCTAHCWRPSIARLF
jgi:hypothetical protein